MMYWILRITGWCLSQCPASALRGLAKALAIVGFDVLRLRRGLVLTNLRRVFADQLSAAEQRQLARDCYFQTILTAMEVLRTQQYDPVIGLEFAGREHVDAALAAGKGAVLLVAHLGNWEIFGAAMSRLICPTHVLVKPIATPGVQRYIEERRRLNGMLTITRQRPGDGLRAVIRVLRANQLVGFILDQSRPGEPKLPFFNQLAKTNTSLAAIWQRYPVPVIPAYIERLGMGRHRIHLLPPLDLGAPSGADGEILLLTGCFNQAIEGMVRACPAQYFWLHDRWKA